MNPQHVPSGGPNTCTLQVENTTLFQSFEWDVPSDFQHWNRLQRVLPRLKDIGIDNIWLPPACKGGHPHSNCYDPYDHFDLGEFEQKGSRSTKWGSKEELLQLSEEARRLNVGLYFDAVLNHRCGGDATETVTAVKVDPKDHTKIISKPLRIKSYLKFTFSGRNGAYSPFRFSWHQFNASDYDSTTKSKAIFKIIEDGKDWADDVDKTEKGNADYLMMNNLDYTDRSLREEMKYWGYWITRELGLSGLRLDATQHVSHNFTNEWIEHINTATGRRLFVVGEFWNGDVRLLLDWLSRSPYDFHLFDVPLFYNLAKMSWTKNPDLRTIFRNTLVYARPKNAVTFVMNHDTQKGQVMDQPINPHFVPHAYALILLRQAGYPCVFYGDLFGICGPHPSPPTGYGKLADSILARKLYAYGEQVDYFQRPDCIGWVRMGSGSTTSPASSGMAVMISWVQESMNPSLAALQDMAVLAEADRATAESHGIRERLRVGPRLLRRSWHGTSSEAAASGAPRLAQQSVPTASSRKRMFVGRQRAGQVWRDLLGWEWADVRIDQDGFGLFPCQKNSIAVFVNVNAPGREGFPVRFDSDIYKQNG